MSTDFSTSSAMRSVLERMVKYAGKGSIDRVHRWVHVGIITGHGSGYSAAICSEFGEDPEEMVGGLNDGKYCPSCGTCQGCGQNEQESNCDEDCEE